MAKRKASNKNDCDKAENRVSTNATSVLSHPFSCPSCNKSFRYKLALKKHICSKNRTEPQRQHEITSFSSASNHHILNTAIPMKSSRPSSTWESSSDDEAFNGNLAESDKSQRPNGDSRQNQHGDITQKQIRPKIKSKGRPCGNTRRIPRLLIHRKNFGSGDCPDCGESYPNKEILKLHTCKSYLGLETENTYRADRENVELFSRTTQRRSLEESPPLSPSPRTKKKRTYRSRNRRSRSRSSPKRSDSRNSSKSQNLDTESSLNNPVSSTEDDEPKVLSRGFSAINPESNVKPSLSTTCLPLKTRILSSIIQNEPQFQESSETDDNGSIINRAINSLEKEMAKSGQSGLNNTLLNDSSEITLNSSLEKNSTSRFVPNIDSQTPSSSNKYSEKSINETNDKLLEASVAFTDQLSNISQLDKRLLDKDFLSCEQCGKPFSDQTLLTDHILEEHDSDPFD